MGTDTLLVERLVVERGRKNHARQHAAGHRGQVTRAEQHLALPRDKLHGGAGVGHVGLAVGFAIAVAADRAVGVVGHGQVHRPCRFLLGRSAERFRAQELVAPRQPLARRLLGVDDRVERRATAGLDRHHAAPALVEGREPHPGDERLLAERAGQRSRDRIALAIEHEPCLAEFGAVVERDRHPADRVLGPLAEIPAAHRLWRRGAGFLGGMRCHPAGAGRGEHVGDVPRE